MKRWIVLILIAVMFAALFWFAFACRQTSQSASTAAATAPEMANNGSSAEPIKIFIRIASSWCEARSIPVSPGEQSGNVHGRP